MTVFALIKRLRNYFLELHLRKVGLHHNGAFNRETWQLTDSPEGVKPTFTPLCHRPSCNTVMLLRKSVLASSGELNYVNSVIDLYYKCPKCGFVVNYGIAVPNNHFRKILALRKRQGIGFTYAPTEEWTHKEEIKKRLQELRYF